MTTKESIINPKLIFIFYLELELKLYRVDFVNQNIELVDEITRSKDFSKNPLSRGCLAEGKVGDVLKTKESKFLNLSDRFEDFWKKNLGQIKNNEEVDIYFFLGFNSGFTDTRIISIWLKTMQMFNEKARIFFEKRSFLDELNETDFKEIEKILKETQTQKFNQIDYTREPNIGSKM